jgi:26S proteasome regulatory subunit N5
LLLRHKPWSLSQAIDFLFTLEKKCRLGNDITNLKVTVVAMCHLCHDQKDWSKLNATLLVGTASAFRLAATHRRMQTNPLTQRIKGDQQAAPAVEACDPRRRGSGPSLRRRCCRRRGFTQWRQAMEWLEDTPDESHKVQLLTTLVPLRRPHSRVSLCVEACRCSAAQREVTEGKIFVEGQRARLTRQLATIKEVGPSPFGLRPVGFTLRATFPLSQKANGDVAGACDCMLELYVETYGALSKREKIDFILEQIRLTIAKQDWVRVLIVAKKVQQKVLDEPDHQDLKLRYHRLMITSVTLPPNTHSLTYCSSHRLCRYYLRQKDEFELANCFHALYTTPLINDEHDDTENGWKMHLRATVLFLCLAKHSNHQVGCSRRECSLCV